jgi:hypothetical protein
MRAAGLTSRDASDALHNAGPVPQRRGGATARALNRSGLRIGGDSEAARSGGRRLLEMAPCYQCHRNLLPVSLAPNTHPVPCRNVMS